MSNSRMFVTDLDNTLVGNPPALRHLIGELERHTDLYLVYATGRSHASVRQLIEEQNLPTPHCVAARVGTMLYYQRRRSLRYDSRYHAALEACWDPELIYAAAARCSELEPQPPHEHDRFKCSFLVDRSALARVTEHLRRELRASEQRATYIFSSHRNLDIVPHGAGKGAAVQYLLRRTGIDPNNAFICGDSGNDTSMLLLRCRCAAVGNASPELLDALEAHGPHVYRARGHAAAGILEALEALRFFSP